MNATPAIRPGKPGDAASCAQILNDWIDGCDWMPRIHSRDDVVRHYREFVFVKRDVWVAGDPVRGFIGLDPDTQHVTTLYAARPGQGIGQRLLDHAKTLHDRLDLWTFQANDGARRFYKREGFAEVEMTNGDNEEGLPDVRLTWERRTDA